LARALSRQIAGLRRRETYVSYRESFPFAGELRELVEAIHHKVLPALPARAFALVDAFLLTDNDTFERVDDSAGVVGDAYREACLLWLDAAARCKGDEDWVERVRKTVAQNDYGVRDPLLPNADRLLTEHELRRLARHYEESGARFSETLTTGVPFEAIRCWSDMAQVAKALRDPVLFERARTNSRTRVDDRLRLEVANLCIVWGKIDEALVRLEAASGSDGYERNSLLLRCYEALDDVPRQVELLWSLFEELPHYATFSRLLELTPRSQREAARERARDVALGYNHPVTVVEFLLRSGWEADAERIAIERREGFEGVPLLPEPAQGHSRPGALEGLRTRRTLLPASRKDRPGGHRIRASGRPFGLRQGDPRCPPEEARVLETRR
jgi:hypothetical protein